VTNAGDADIKIIGKRQENDRNMFSLNENFIFIYLKNPNEFH